MAPVTNFTIKDPYIYLEGFGNYHQSEAIPGASPQVINSPQKPPFELRTERISGTSFTAPRNQNLQTWLYRAKSSMKRSTFSPFEGVDQAITNPPSPHNLSPESYFWPKASIPSGETWISQHLLGGNGDPVRKEGIALYLFAITESMPSQTAFSSHDGESLIIPQSGALDISTEMGRLIVRQHEFAVIPRAVRYRVSLPDGKPCRGYICELFQGHFQLPNLGAVGSTGLANVRDFQIPTAWFDGSLVTSGAGDPVAQPNRSGDWTIVSRLGGRLWSCTQSHTPFDVAAWHGTLYPYKYDLAKFCVLGNVAFDEHDPSLYVVLTAPSYGSAPGTAVVDFAVVPERWQVAEDTYWLPYWHRNTMQEFYAPVINRQDERYPLNGGHEFRPFAAGLHGCLTTHGASEQEWEAAKGMDTKSPVKVGTDGVTVVLLETERPLLVSDWAQKLAQSNPKARTKGIPKL